MLAKTGLLIVSNPNQISKVLCGVQKSVEKTLYIQLLSALTDPFGSFHPNVFNTWPKFSKTISGIYSQAAKHCNDLDVHVLLSGIKYDIPQIKTKLPIDIVIFDKKYSEKEIENFIKQKVQSIAEKYNVVTLESCEYKPENIEDSSQNKVYKHCVLGGTFDRLHIAHKLLLSEAALRSESKVTVGVTDENMIKDKLLSELIEDLSIRIQNVEKLFQEICPELNYDIVKIGDPFGPAIIDPTMEMIVVSEETQRGGAKINQIRKERNLNELDTHLVELIDETNISEYEESKISSSNTRLRLLGTLLKPVEKNDNIPQSPYVIGLTGGIASGKSNIAQYLEELGTLVINCDTLAHKLYQKGKPCHKNMVEHFGAKILDSNGEIDRKVVGGIVFKDPDELNNLNSILWPAMADEVRNIISKTDKEVVVVEAAVLLTAGWQKYCHEVWSTMVPEKEAIQRLVKRNSLTEEQAKNRIDSQPKNDFYVKSSNVVFCSLWPKEYTKVQVLKAWDFLQKRLPKKLVNTAKAR